MVEKLKEQDNNATIKIVKATINNLQSAYNKELKKVKEAAKSRARNCDIYEPSLWYYDLFMSLMIHKMFVVVEILCTTQQMVMIRVLKIK